MEQYFVALNKVVFYTIIVHDSYMTNLVLPVAKFVMWRVVARDHAAAARVTVAEAV